MAPKTYTRQIIDGPSRYHLMTYGPMNDKPTDQQERVRFTVTDGRQNSEELIKVVKVGREDGSGRNFLIGGYNTNNARVEIFYTLATKHGQKGHMVFNPFKQCPLCKGEEPLSHRYCGRCGIELPKAS